MVLCWGLPALGDQADGAAAVRAHIRLTSPQVALGQPVWVQFSIENVSDKPITLTVPGTEPEIPLPEVGLPLSHVFSGGAAGTVAITTESNRRWDQPVGYRGAPQAPILLIAPNSTVGSTLDLRDYFPSLRGAGQYRICWRPYGGEFTSETIVLTVAPFKQVELVTDEGAMTIRLLYDDAPGHVANFIDLVKSGFYGGKTFHRIEPGYMIQGGCPRGDGTGIRLDGKRIPAEYNTRRHRKGTVSMALLDDDANSASCQFFICNTEQKAWDGRYTVFGELVGDASIATLDKLMAAPVDDRGRPLRTLYMRTVRLMDAPSEPMSP